ncbi:uncharacterized protein A4U43_C07F25910 [Asparagus officinalis]|uniref:Uncharacterized protein n=1 Tax=Asparagus officinalis TaxID=4686 RepID=A0A5P1EEY4_ASPOF|nr:uncharacterized protein A4U43_C07F25910 [Asparagus officinalis]
MALVAVGDQQEYFFDVGFKFKPTDVEILDHYVRRRFSGSPEPNFLIKSEEVSRDTNRGTFGAHSFRFRGRCISLLWRRLPRARRDGSPSESTKDGKWTGKSRREGHLQQGEDGEKRGTRAWKMVFRWDKLVFCKIYKKKELGEGEGGEEEEERCAKRQRVCLENYESTANGIPPPAAETPSSSTGGAHSETSSSSSLIPLAAVDYGASYSNYYLEDHLQCPEFDPMISLDDFELSAAALALPAAETSPSTCIVSPISRLMDGTHDEHELASADDDDSAFYAKLSEDFNASHHEIAKLLEDNPSTQRLHYRRPL